MFYIKSILKFYLVLYTSSYVLFEQFTLGFIILNCAINMHPSRQKKNLLIYLFLKFLIATRKYRLLSAGFLCEGFWNSRISFIKINTIKILGRQKDSSWWNEMLYFHLIWLALFGIVPYYCSKWLDTILSRSISKVTHFKWLHYNEQNMQTIRKENT